MGFTPRQVDEMTLWEFAACSEAFSGDDDGREGTGSRSAAEAVSLDFLRIHGVEGF